MAKRIFIFLFLFISTISYGQQRLEKLTVEKIMRDPKWIGTSPSNLFWSEQTLYFNWNPDNAISDSTYFITVNNHIPVKASVAQKQNIMIQGNVSWNSTRTSYVYSRDGDIFLKDTKTGRTKHILQTTD